MSVTPNLCCDETKNRGAYTRLTNPWVGKIPWGRKWKPTPLPIPVWEMLWTEEPDGLQFMGSQRVGTQIRD